MDSGLKSGISGGLMAGLTSSEEAKFQIVPADCAVSSKVSSKTQRPSVSYIDIEFKKDIETAYFSYIVFQNFYCH